MNRWGPFVDGIDFMDLFLAMHKVLKINFKVRIKPCKFIGNFSLAVFRSGVNWLEGLDCNVH